MNATQLRAAATRARAARQTVHLLPGDAEALADELDRLRAEAATVAHLTAEAEALADELAGDTVEDRP